MLSVAACVSAGCGPATRPQLSADAAGRLHRTLASVRAAALAHDQQQALDALTAMSRLVDRESRAKQLSQADQLALRTGIAQARRRVRLDVAASAPPPPPPPPTTVQQPAPAPAPQAAPGEKGGGQAKAKKPNGKGKG